MTVRCKMICTKAGTAHDKPEDGFVAEFQAVADGSPENEAFFKATPGAMVTLQVTNQQHFVEGQEYYFDITPATAAGEAPSGG